MSPLSHLILRTALLSQDGLVSFYRYKDEAQKVLVNCLNHLLQDLVATIGL